MDLSHVQHAVDSEFGHHYQKYALAPTATALAFPGVSQTLVSTLESAVLAAGGAAGAIAWGPLFQAIWPLILKFGTPLVMAIIQAILGQITGGGTPPVPVTPPVVAPPTPTGPVITQTP